MTVRIKWVRGLMKATAAGVVLGALAMPAMASPLWGTSALGELTGSRDSSAGGGVIGTQAWDNGGFNIAWNISFDDQTDLWTYVYDVTVDRKAVSHFLLEVTEDDNDFLIGQGSSAITEIKTYSPGDNGNSNPLLPNALYGGKFDFGAEEVTYTLVTDRAPVYGVFYAKDGKDGGKDVVAWAAALSNANYKTSESLSAIDFIVRPNGGSHPDDDTPTDPEGDPDPRQNPVPEPATAALGFMGLVGLTVNTLRRRRR